MPSHARSGVGRVGRRAACRLADVSPRGGPAGGEVARLADDVLRVEGSPRPNVGPTNLTSTHSAGIGPVTTQDGALRPKRGVPPPNFAMHQSHCDWMVNFPMARTLRSGIPHPLQDEELFPRARIGMSSASCILGAHRAALVPPMTAGRAITTGTNGQWAGLTIKSPPPRSRTKKGGDVIEGPTPSNGTPIDFMPNIVTTNLMADYLNEKARGRSRRRRGARWGVPLGYAAALRRRIAR